MESFIIHWNDWDVFLVILMVWSLSLFLMQNNVVKLFEMLESKYTKTIYHRNFNNCFYLASMSKVFIILSFAYILISQLRLLVCNLCTLKFTLCRVQLKF